MQFVRGEACCASSLQIRPAMHWISFWPRCFISRSVDRIRYHLNTSVSDKTSHVNPPSSLNLLLVKAHLSIYRKKIWNISKTASASGEAHYWPSLFQVFSQSGIQIWRKSRTLVLLVSESYSLKGYPNSKRLSSAPLLQNQQKNLYAMYLYIQWKRNSSTTFATNTYIVQWFKVMLSK